MGIKKARIAIDVELAAAAKKVLGTSNLKDTVENALREVLRAHARRDEAAALAEMRGMDLDQPAVMAKSWPP